MSNCSSQEKVMRVAADSNSPADPNLSAHDTARELTQRAVEAYAKEGNQEAGDDLTEQARALDLDAVAEVYQDLRKDTGSSDPA